jgi:hypothetical protein
MCNSEIPFLEADQLVFLYSDVESAQAYTGTHPVQVEIAMTENIEGPIAFSVFAANGMPDVPLYLLSFNKQGECISPRTRAKVLAEASSGKYSAVHIYSHGWNNVFDEAVRHYTEFFTEYFALRQSASVPNNDYRPMIVGIIWPSTAFLASHEVTPTFAAGGADVLDAAIPELAAELPPEKGRRLVELASNGKSLGVAGSKELAELLVPLLAREEQGDGMERTGSNDASAEDVLRSWGVDTTLQDVRPGMPRKLPDEGSKATDAPMAAGFFEFLNPREIVRKATVFLMKDRAGVVGRSGVGDLLRDILRGSTIKTHLTGHSYGARVILAALASLKNERKVASVLLLQPAVNAYCFAEHIDQNEGRAGAYRAALDNTEIPVYTTFSERDRALSDFFKLALRRRGDIGDLESAPLDNQFAALGAVGPLGMPDGERVTLPMLEHPGKYPPPVPGVRVVALNGSVNGIASHGDVRNAFTEWVMVNLVSRQS